jgi:hypothetical protein
MNRTCGRRSIKTLHKVPENQKDSKNSVSRLGYARHRLELFQFCLCKNVDNTRHALMLSFIPH